MSTLARTSLIMTVALLGVAPRGATALTKASGPVVVLHESVILGSGRYIALRDAVDCAHWYYFPKSWQQVPGAFSVAVDLRAEGPLRERRYFPEAYYTSQFTPVDEVSDLTLLRSDLGQYQDSVVARETAEIAQGRLQASEAFFSGHCAAGGTLNLERLPAQALQTDFQVARDPAHPDDWIEVSRTGEGKELLSVTQRFNLLSGDRLEKITDALRNPLGGKLSWGDFVPGRVTLDSLRIGADTYITAEAKVMSWFNEVIRDPKCWPVCDRSCHPKKVWFVTVGTECEDHCHNQCSEPLHEFFFKEATQEGSVEMNFTSLWPERFPEAQLWEGLFSGYLVSNFGERFTKLSEDVTRVEFGRLYKEGSTDFHFSKRFSGADQLHLEDSLEVEASATPAQLAPLTRFAESDFLKCARALAGGDEMVSLSEGYFTAKMPCPMYPEFEGRIDP